tara:strand:- start:507 stop:1004 length:498 start_codon:yes stop_codon:yes gene_type:complete
LIYIAIGSNLTGDNNITPLENCKKAVAIIKKHIIVKKISHWYKSKPIPSSNQPWFVNGVIEVKTDKSSINLLDLLLKVEKDLGRVRNKKNEARIIDLDIIDYKKKIFYKKNRLIIPHPRMHERAFVLLPMRDLNPKWYHPIKKKSLNALIKKIKNKQKIFKIIKN